MHRLRTRFLIASGARARWVDQQAFTEDPVTVAELAPTAAHHPRGPAHVSFESASGMRHGPSNRSEAERRRADFAAEIAEEIQRQATANEFDRLGLVAPARLLRAVHERLPRSVQAMVCFQLARDLSKQPNHELRNWIAAADLQPVESHSGSHGE